MRPLWLALLAVTCACENIVTLTGQIQVAADVAPDRAAPILLLITDDYRYPAETTEGMWGTKPGGVYAIDASFGAAPDSPNAVGKDLSFQPTVASYPYWHMEGAYYPSKIWLGAFIDTNGNGEPDAGEPYGVCAANPLTDIPLVPGDHNLVRADIVINRRW